MGTFLLSMVENYLGNGKKWLMGQGKKMIAKHYPEDNFPDEEVPELPEEEEDEDD